MKMIKKILPYDGKYKSLIQYEFQTKDKKFVRISFNGIHCPKGIYYKHYPGIYHLSVGNSFRGVWLSFGRNSLN